MQILHQLSITLCCTHALIVQAIVVASLSETIAVGSCSSLLSRWELEESTATTLLHGLSKGFVSADLNVTD